MFPPHSFPTAGIGARFQVIAAVPVSSRCSIISAQLLMLSSPKTVISRPARVFFLLHSTRKHLCARARAASQWAAQSVPVSIENVQLELTVNYPPQTHTRPWQRARASLCPCVRIRTLRLSAGKRRKKKSTISLKKHKNPQILLF